MANAFYRNSSSSAKKNSDRERRQSVFSASEESSDAAVREAAAEKEASSRKSASSRSEGRGVFTWRANITPSALVTISVLALVLLGFSFLSGVIVGRSSMPLPQALELEKLLAEDSPEGESEAEEKEKILPKEELRFMTSLKSDASGGVLSDVPTAPAPSVTQAAQEKPKQEKSKEEVQKPKEPQFDYVLRVAAFKEQAQAKALYDRLTKDGLKARRTQTKTKRGTWYYVQVLFRGGKADLQLMRRTLDKYGLHDAMLISEKAVKGK
ncbi:SPOR domain-containing protein [Mailhella massiliensis]|uniref:SPOR domain-containing protein n=1 Tax=Mailhella massiliensis TaxID=1903261 RepID=A0A921DQP3_9BACT|nr:SPOR domain-containing protein [Mailhella massiliensis]HJD96710.1 SPOR domain-containing protein [Mailhella massiliensis]